jgi:predicted DCC family thiol-disulfide oxidoreductase YuxK
MSPDKPVLLYDGDCGFCRRWIERWRGVTRDAVEYAPYQAASGRFPGIARAEFESSVILVEPGGKTSRGAEAVFRSLAASHAYRWMLWSYYHIPGARPSSEAFYGFVAAHRGKLKL